jgi:hypothetical protein
MGYDSAKFTTTSPSLINFNWQDFFKGVGYITYYVGTFRDSSATSYLMTTATLDSQPIRFTAGSSPVDKDFDLDFEKEETVKGIFLINFTQRAGSTGASGTVSTVINIYHVDSDSTETLLGTATTPSRSASGTYYRESIKIDVGIKPFSPGEKLRINIIVTGSGNVASVYLDPASRVSFTGSEGGTIGSDFKIQIPFKIDL